MKKTLTFVCAIATPLLFSQSAFAAFDYFKTDGSFKRFSVSAGWLHASPQGTANPLENTTAIKDGTVAKNGSVKIKTVREVIDPDQSELTKVKVNTGLTAIGVVSFRGEETDLSRTTLGDVSGQVKLGGLENFSSPGTGLESADVDTFGSLFNYYLNDNWSIEVKAGFPPKVNIMGKGRVYAPISGEVTAGGIGEYALPKFKIKKEQLITDLEQGDGVASKARAWLPAAGVQYQFGKSGVNKFRPYVGAGVMYAYFNGIELNEGIRKDLEAAGHQIQNIKDGKSGAALENVPSNREMNVDVEAESAFAPIVTVGATYDFNDRWFGVGSLSYAKLDSDTTITVNNDKNEELIRSKAHLDIDPYITFLGVGYRF